MSCIDTEFLINIYRRLAYKDAKKRSLSDFESQSIVSRWLQSNEHRGETAELLLRKAVELGLFDRPGLVHTYETIRSALYDGRTLNLVYAESQFSEDSSTLIASPMDIGIACLYLHCFDHRESLAALSKIFGWTKDDPTLKRWVWNSVRTDVHSQLYSLLNAYISEVQMYRSKEVRLLDGKAIVHNEVSTTIYDPVFLYQRGIKHHLLELEGEESVEFVSSPNRRDRAAVWAELSPNMRDIRLSFAVQPVPMSDIRRWILTIRVDLRGRKLEVGDLLNYKYELVAPKLQKRERHLVYIVAAHGTMGRATLALTADDSYQLIKPPEFGLSTSPDPNYYEAYRESGVQTRVRIDSTDVTYEGWASNVSGLIGMTWEGEFR